MLHILLVDDNPDDRVLAARALQQGFSAVDIQSIIDAPTFEQALEGGAFDVVVTDYQLLWSNGLAVLEKVKAQYPNCPVLMFTNSANQETAIAAMKSGLDDYLVKCPRHYARLPLIVQSVLQRAQAKQALEAEREQLLERERAARRRAEAEERRFAFLAEASRLLSSSLEFDTVLKQVAQLAVPNLADWCLVDIIDGDFINWREPVIAAIDPEKELLVRELKQKFPPTIDDDYGPAKVLRTGEPELVANLSDAFAIEIVQNVRHLTLLHQLEAKSLMVVPIKLAERILGTISFVSSQIDRHYAIADLDMAMELARRSAFAIENARLYREAQEANRLKDEFLAIVSHELRTPLNSISGWAQMLGKGKLTPAMQAKAIETIDRNARLQTRLVDDIIDAALIIQNQIHLARHPVNLIPIIDAVIQSVRAAAEEKSIQIETQFDLSVERVLGDAKRLQQIVWNLLSNAIKFTPKGGRVEVRLTQINRHLQLQIIDTGKGITAQFMPHIYDRFRQADSSIQRSFGGLGLGLTIVRHLVEMHGGTVYATSEGDNRGATFTVQLPVHSIEPLSRTTISSQNFPDLSGLKVLVVEDNSDTLELLRFILSECGAKVTTAVSVEIALRSIRQQVPDLLISDIGMTGQDGYELIHQIRSLPLEQGGNIPAIALTAFATAKFRELTLAKGFQLHLEKPIDPMEFAAIVAKLAEQKVLQLRE
ncbi:response regulator [Leptolyngbya sp. AN03gr2]|uniref:hybrid sensor histidine kinase/response regulator n=1 Tax=unclassified Leptolyngbya TaxID=2650499 RepID=UPI003D31AC9D